MTYVIIEEIMNTQYRIGFISDRSEKVNIICPLVEEFHISGFPLLLAVKNKFSSIEEAQKMIDLLEEIGRQVRIAL